MANRVTVMIRGRLYPIVAEEEEAYIRQCADLVAQKLEEAMEGNTLSLTDGAVLAGLNLADQYMKEKQVSDNLRSQLKQALDENTRLRHQNAQQKKAARAAAKQQARPAPQQPAPAQAEPGEDAGEFSR